MKRLRVAANMDNFLECMTFIESQLKLAKLDKQNTLKTLTASEELVVNVISYAYPNGEGEIEIVFEDLRDKVLIMIIDNGKEFNPLQKDTNKIDNSIEDREPGGLGILMVKKLVDQIEYEHKDGQNQLTIIKQKTDK